MINTYANYMRLVEELEQEQAGHAETRKLLLKACNERDGLLESIRYIYAIHPELPPPPSLKHVSYSKRLTTIWIRCAGK